MPAMTEPQFKYLVSLTAQVYTDPGARAAELLQLAGLDFAGASAKIDALKPLAKAAPAVMPAYVPPFGTYQVAHNEVQVKKAKYGDAVYVYLNGYYQGTLGKNPKAAEAIAELDSADAAYAAVVAWAGKTHKCGVCHKKLTDPQSIAAGIGPTCAKKYGKTI